MECDYCGEELEETQGKMLVQSGGKKLYFCSGKCEKNWKKDRSHDYSKE